MYNESQRNQRYSQTNMVNDFVKSTSVEQEDGTNVHLTLNIWDAAGDNNVHNLAHLFVQNVQCGILVYGIDSRISFDQLTEWHKHLKDYNEDCLLVLVGNKSDL